MKKTEGECFLDYKLAIMRRQLVKNIKELKIKLSVHQYIGSSVKLIEYVRLKSFEDARFIARYCDSFIKEKLKNGTSAARWQI
ncbi:MAG: hypothetical protein V6Z82_02235 [Flavobacteriales bacterium]